MSSKPAGNVAILAQATHMLSRYGVHVHGKAFDSVSLAAQNLLIFQAINLAAKKKDKAFYHLKANVFVAAAEVGYEAGVCVHRGVDKKGNAVWAIYHPEVGTIGCHDKFGEIDALLKNKSRIRHTEMHQWTEASRQHYGFLQLREPEVLEFLTERTRPDFDAGAEAARRHVNQEWADFIDERRGKNPNSGQGI